MFQCVINNQGKRLISDTMFRALLPPELRMMKNYYKQMCMCEVCQSSTYMQSALNTFRRNNLSQLEKEYQNYSALSSHEKYAKSILLAQLKMYKIEEFNGKGDHHMYPTPRQTAAATQCPSQDGLKTLNPQEYLVSILVANTVDNIADLLQKMDAKN